MAWFWGLLLADVIAFAFSLANYVQIRRLVNQARVAGNIALTDSRRERAETWYKILLASVAIGMTLALMLVTITVIYKTPMVQ